MCESDAYVLREGEESLLMEAVSRLDVEGGRLVLIDVMGRRKEIEGVIQRIDFEGHRVFIRKTGD